MMSREGLNNTYWNNWVSEPWQRRSTLQRTLGITDLDLLITAISPRPFAGILIYWCIEYCNRCSTIMWSSTIKWRKNANIAANGNERRWKLSGQEINTSRLNTSGIFWAK